MTWEDLWEPWREGNRYGHETLSVCPVLRKRTLKSISNDAYEGFHGQSRHLAAPDLEETQTTAVDWLHPAVLLGSSNLSFEKQPRLHSQFRIITLTADSQQSIGWPLSGFGTACSTNIQAINSQQTLRNLSTGQPNLKLDLESRSNIKNTVCSTQVIEDSSFTLKLLRLSSKQHLTSQPDSLSKCQYEIGELQPNWNTFKFQDSKQLHCTFKWPNRLVHNNNTLLTLSPVFVWNRGTGIKQTVASLALFN